MTPPPPKKRKDCNVCRKSSVLMWGPCSTPVWKWGPFSFLLSFFLSFFFLSFFFFLLLSLWAAHRLQVRTFFPFSSALDPGKKKNRRPPPKKKYIYTCIYKKKNYIYIYIYIYCKLCQKSSVLMWGPCSTLVFDFFFSLSFSFLFSFACQLTSSTPFVCEDLFVFFWSAPSVKKSIKIDKKLLTFAFIGIMCSFEKSTDTSIHRYYNHITVNTVYTWKTIVELSTNK